MRIAGVRCFSFLEPAFTVFCTETPQIKEGQLMAKHFDLKRQLRLHDKGLLRRLFAEHGLLDDFP